VRPLRPAYPEPPVGGQSRLPMRGPGERMPSVSRGGGLRRRRLSLNPDLAALATVAVAVVMRAFLEPVIRRCPHYGARRRSGAPCAPGIRVTGRAPQARLARRCGTAVRASEGVAACASCSPRSPASGISLPWRPWRETLVGGGHHVAVATGESFSETVQAAGLAHIAAGLGNAVAAEGVRPPTRRYGRRRLRRWSGGCSSRCS
jgi:hypothetical protein